MSYGITLKHGKGGDRLEIQCMHQSGLMYIVPSEANWVCSEEHLHAHALAGFLRELSEFEDISIVALMRRWGLYFRARPLPESTPEERDEPTS